MLEDCLSDLRAAIAEARELGLEVAAAETVVARAEQRLGFAGSVYVLALAGGTGVGKSSLLNALAGRLVSPVRAIRPTTGEPVVWVSDARRQELAPMLEWLGSRHVVGHAEPELAHLAIVDLPDFDSVYVEHRQRFEAFLPRVDAMAWVLDPEKYDDGRLHDGYLRPLARHADRFLFVLNKADRLTNGQTEQLRADLQRRLASDGIDGPPIFVVSARDRTGELEELLEVLARAADGKAVISDKVRVDALIAARQLTIQAGFDADSRPSPLVPPTRRASAVSEATAAALETINLPEVMAQARREVRERARLAGASPVVRLFSRLRRASRLAGPPPDPIAFLRAWRSRGTLARAANPIRQLASDAALAAPPAWRPRLMEFAAVERVENAVSSALDRAAGERARDGRPADSRAWRTIGTLQVAASGLIALAVLWYATLLLAPGLPISTIAVPLLGPVPTPLLVLVVGVVAVYVLTLVLHAHADWVGRRWGERIAGEVRRSVEGVIARDVVAPLDELETRRTKLWEAVQRMTVGCADPPA